MKILEWIKHHPYASAGVVVATGILWIFTRKNSGGGTSNPYAGIYDAQASEVASANQLQGLQLQAQTATNQITAAANVENQKTAAAVSIAGLQAQTSQNNNTVNDQTAQAIAALQAQTATAISTLQAQVENAKTQATTDQANIMANAYTTLNAQNTAAEVAIASLPYTNITVAQAQALQSQITSLHTGLNQVGQDLQAAFTNEEGLGTPLTQLPGADPTKTDQYVQL